jgi:hypothetical protein
MDPWLWPMFQARGYDKKKPADFLLAEAAMATLIDRLNKMQQEIVQEYAPFAKHVDLRTHFGGQGDPNRKRWWSNALHPTEAGFKRLAEVVAREIEAVAAVRS